MAAANEAYRTRAYRAGRERLLVPPGDAPALAAKLIDVCGDASAARQA
ncbi:MAG: hypothetical protein HPM95_05215 [Alphaproteobacteria bacterium]|nr:hypothetical protein [Alphaproteobacteria bacterium]